MSDHPFARGGRKPDTRWQRWMPDSLDAPVQAPEPEPEEDPIPDAAQIRAEIEHLKLTAQKLGHAEGYSAGHTQGMQQGIKEGLEQGQQQGYDSGFAAGHSAGMKQADQELAQLHAVAQSAAESIARLESDMGQALIQFAVHIAEQVLHSTLALQPQVVIDVVRDILRMDTHNSALLTLRVHPHDYHLVYAYLETDPAAGNWRLLADETLRRGDCLAETPLGTIDATLATRWQRVTAALGHPLPLGPTPEPAERALPWPTGGARGAAETGTASNAAPTASARATPRQRTAPDDATAAVKKPRTRRKATPEADAHAPAADTQTPGTPPDAAPPASQDPTP